MVVHDERLDNDNVMRIFEGYDLIVDGTDNFATRYMVNDAAYFLGIPYVWGSIYRFDGQASVFCADRSTASDAPCYRCLYPEPPPPGMVPSCAEGGVLGVLCASIGSIQVNEAIKLLTGIGDPLVGKLMIYDALEMEYRKLRGPQGPELRAVRREPDRHRADRLRDLLRRDLRGGRRRRRRLDDLGRPARAHAQGARRGRPRLRAGRRARAQRVRDQPDPRLGADPQGRVPQRQRARAAARRDKQIVMHCKTGVRSAETLAIVKGAGLRRRRPRRRRRGRLGQPDRPVAAVVLTPVAAVAPSGLVRRGPGPVTLGVTRAGRSWR